MQQYLEANQSFDISRAIGHDGKNGKGKNEPSKLVDVNLAEHDMLKEIMEKVRL